jgi:catechol 2,3-dioxygenase-like lactoylglutathione lyase family enzyme
VDAPAIRQVRGLLLEHVNINVPDRAIARAFFCDALGGRENPVGTNARQLHVNVGVSQFHLPTARSVADPSPVTVAQHWSGVIELLSAEPLAAVGERARALGFDARETAGGALAVDGPWASAYVLRAAPAGLADALATVRGHDGGAGPLLALTKATVAVRPGHAPRIAAFYRDVLGLEVEESAGRCAVRFEPAQRAAVDVTEPDSASVGASAGAGLPAQSLEFEEHPDAPDADAYDRDEAAAVHVALYMPDAASFEAAFRRAERAGLLYVNSRFEGGPPEFASAMSLEAALQLGQFRVKDCRAPAGAEDGGGKVGPLGLVLEHEIRHPGHRSFPLVERPPPAGGAQYVPGS